jgi:hypothetical protein
MNIQENSVSSSIVCVPVIFPDYQEFNITIKIISRLSLAERHHFRLRKAIISYTTLPGSIESIL